MPYSNFSGLTLVTPPSSDPVTIADVRAHSRIYSTAHDSLIASYISTATMACETTTKRAFLTQTWRLALEQWPGRSPVVGYREATSMAEYWKWNYIALPLPPLQSITSFTYADTTGLVYNMNQLSVPGQMGQTTVGNYLLDLETEPGRVRLPFAGIWPVTILLPGSPILITYVCGWPSYSGAITVDQSGAATQTAGDPFVPQLRGTWINVGGVSLNVIAYIDSTHLLLSASVGPDGAPVTPPGGGSAAYTANTVPQPIRTAILYLAAHLYENREPIVVGRSQTAIEIPSTIDAMLEPYKIRRTG